LDQVDLPWIAGTARLTNAVDAMVRHGTSGVVAETAKGPQVYDVDIVLYGLHHVGNHRIATLTPRFRTVVIAPRERGFAAEAMSTAVAMDRASAAFAIIRDQRLVLTRGEAYRNIIGSNLILYQCNNNSEHVYFSEELDQGGLCPICRCGTEIMGNDV
jgi:hypothetical protein